MLICIMGNSGAGKDTITDKVLFHANIRGIKIDRLLTVTNRPRRMTEENGSAPYLFVTPEYFDTLINEDKLIEHRSYTVNQPSQKYWRYGTVKYDFTNVINSDDIYITVCSKSQFNSYYWYCRSINMAHKLYPIFLDVTDKERLLRSINRIDNNDIIGLKETCRRFYNDSDYIYPSTVSSRFSIFNDDIEETANFILDLVDTFINNDWNNDMWVSESKDPSTMGGLIYL